MTDDIGITRRMALRRTALAMGSAAAVTFAVPAAEAWAMHPKFNQTLYLDEQGRVLISGPTHWNTGERAAVIQSVIVQGDRSALGHPVHVSAPAASWYSATTATLSPGAAIAYGWAVVFDTDGASDQYPWEVDVTLVHGG